MSTPEVYALSQLQAIAVGLLAQDDMFMGNQSANGAAIPVVGEDVGDVMTELSIKIDSLGLCVVVQVAEFEFTNEWASQAGAVSYDGLASFEIMVIENVTLNKSTGGTQIPALAVAERIVRLMHGQPTGLPDNPNNPSHFMGKKKALRKTSEGPPLIFTTFVQAHLTLITPSV